MINRRIAKIKFRSEKYNESKKHIFDVGELVYLSDKKKLVIGDGVTYGGIRASNRNFVLNVSDIPSFASFGDIIYNKKQDTTYIVGKDFDNVTPKLIEISNRATFTKLQNEIQDLYNKLRPLTGCLVGGTPPDPATVPDLPVFMSWAANKDTSWYSLENWYDNGVFATSLPNGTRDVVIDSTDTVIVDLDNISWVQPKSITLINSLGQGSKILFVSYTYKSVTCPIINDINIILSGNASYHRI